MSHWSHHWWRSHAVHHRRMSVHRTVRSHHHRWHTGGWHSWRHHATSSTPRWRTAQLMGRRYRDAAATAADFWRRCSEWILCDFAGLKCSGCRIDQMLCLFFHPFLIVELDVVAMLATGTVGFADAGRIVRKVCVAVVAVVFRHDGFL